MLSLKFLYKSPVGALITGWKRRETGDVVLPAERDPNLDDDPIRASYVRSIPQAQLFRGVLLQGYLVPPSVLRGMEDIEIKEDDVFIITYPKSGTTWTEEIVSLIFNDGDLRRVESKPLIYRVQHLEVGRPLGHLRHLKKLKSPRLLATHLPLPLIPRQLRQAKCKIIYVVRNPKDTAVSYYHHHKMSTFLGNFSGNWDEFLPHFMAGNVVYGSWFDHTLPYWKFCNENPDKVFFLSYEELKMDLLGMVSRLSKFLGKNLTVSSLDAITRHCSFEEMKTNSMVNREVLPISDLFDMTQSKFMRKGIIGDWKNYFTLQQNEAFDKLYKEKMADSGLDLVFEANEAFERMRTHGRLILNHPQCPDKQEKESTPNCDSEENRWSSRAICRSRPRYVTRRHFLPALQIHVQPDPLTLDAI